MKILLAGGGTAGHINPAIAIAKYAVNKDNSEILFVGKKGGMESRLVPLEGFDIEYIDVEGLKRKLTLSNIRTAYKLLTSVGKCKKIIKRFRPDVVVGTGGYVCAPAVIAANKLGIPTLIHEQNAFCGSAIKMLSNKSNVTAISFEQSRKQLSKAKKIVYTGNPVRPGIVENNYLDSRKQLGIGNEKLIVAFGGSLGAKRINEVVCEYIPTLCKKDNIRLIFATGMNNYDDVIKKLESNNVEIPENVTILKYINNMDTVMNAADLVISRSGAITLSELCTVGKPSILIPSPNVTNNHQEHNANAMVEMGAGVKILESEFDSERLSKEIDAILSDEVLYSSMCNNALKLSCKDASGLIYNQLVELVNNK